MSLRPPSTSPSPSPGPHENGKVSARQSMGPSSRGTPTLAPASPRPGGQSSARPTSELLGSGGAMFQTPEAEALDAWFENLQNYEATLEEMAAASLDVNFKEELSAIEQWFKVLSEAERTAALYSLLQHSTQVQIRFFITVLQQMARSDPMTALLSPAMGGSMQSQMEAKLASIKSPGLKSGLPASPTARSFNASATSASAANTPGNRQSLALDGSGSNFLSPDSAAALSTPTTASNANAGTGNDAAAKLAQQREKLRASNAAHRISAPVLSSPGGLGVDGRASWGPSTLLSQVSEQLANTSLDGGNGGSGTASRPKSVEIIGTPARASAVGNASANNSNNNNTSNGNSTPGNSNEATAPAPATVANDSWASMVTTPLVPMFKKEPPKPSADTPTSNNNNGGKGEWHGNAAPGVPRMGDPTIYKRGAKNGAGAGAGGEVYDDNGNPVGARRGGWSNGRSPGLNSNNNNSGNSASNRFGGNNNDGGSDTGSNSMNGLGFNALGSPTMGMGVGVGMPGLGVGVGMQPMSPFNMNMLSMMNMSPEAQMLAAQMAASGFMGQGMGMNQGMGMGGMGGGMGVGGMGMGQPGWMGMSPMSAGIMSAGLGSAGVGGPGRGGMKGPSSARSTSGGGGGGLRSASSIGGRSSSGAHNHSSADGPSSATPKSEEDVDPALLNDVAAWLRSLRLHKYTPNFEGCRWQDMVVMDEGALEAKGVAALGARRKMLKTFEIVRRKMGMEGGGGAPPMSAGAGGA
ncbi:Protein VTS1 [Psilocybe cubensis]|uniref:RNA-binding protein VTS1 n=2 Tax=Psilocybe cubensis TaxID=181762 RepID=A0A8H8CFM9_PSICU|nr:Protein VTS1 [Psilocybe cubensis]KAH9480244.1 Protein VTS1 [Psilocybe cubensis]